MSQGLKMRHVLTVSAIGLILTFQNCSQANYDAEAESQSFEDSLPFAYSAKIDTISYMSCTDMNANAPDKRAYFTLRAGAYGTCNPADIVCQQNPFLSPVAGLTVTKEFRDATKFYDKKQRAHLFGQSSKNANSLLSLSVRSVYNYQSVWKEGNLVPGEELDSFLPRLDSPAVAGPLGFSSEGQMLNYFPGSQSQRLMEASLRQYNFVNTSKFLRDALDGKEALLVMGYTGSADPMDTSLRGPEAPQDSRSTASSNRAYGSGYKLTFNLPFGYQAGDKRVLHPREGVQEIELIDGQPNGASWDCSENYQFMVVRPQDKANGLVACDATVDRYADANQQAALNAIRRVLRVEDWFVDVARKCVMPKRTGDYCYGNIGSRAIQYGLSSCMNGDQTSCPHFVSVCVRR